MTRRPGGPLDPVVLRAVPLLRRHLVTLALLAAAGAGFAVAAAIGLAHVVAAAVLHRAGPGQVSAPLLLLAAAGLGTAVTAALAEWTGRRVSRRARRALRARALDAVVSRGPAPLRTTGPAATACGPAPEALDAWVTRALPALVESGVVPALLLVAVAVLDGWSAVILAALLPLVPVFGALVGLSTRARLERRYAVLTRLSGRFLDVVEGLATLRVYGRAEAQAARLRAATAAYRRATTAALRTGLLTGLALDLVATASIAVVAVEIGLRLAAGAVTLPTALTVLLLAPGIFAPLRAAGAQFHATQDGRVAVDAVLGLVGATSTDRPVRATVGEPGAPPVSWRGVMVAYPERDRPAVHSLDLDVAPGSVTVLEGPSGAGKSTVLLTALGLVGPTAGAVLLGARTGRPSWVPQRPRPVRATVEEEVRLGAPGADPAAVAAALGRCAAPPGATALGEDGTAVSAGQRRRVALARALLHAEAQRAAGREPLLLLDEPSEDLDLVTEAVVADVIASLRGTATVVVATHSPRLAALADRRVRLDAGRVVADVARRPEITAPAPDPTTSAPVTPDAPVAPGPAGDPPAPPRGPGLLRLLLLRGRVLLAAVIAGAAGLAGLGLTATALWLLCRAAQHPGVAALALAVVGVRFFALARAILRHAERLVGHDAALRLLEDLRTRLVRRLVPLVPYGLGRTRRGDVLRTFVTDVDTVQDGVVRAVVPWLGAAVTVTGAAVLGGVLLPAAGVGLAAAGGAALLLPLVAARRGAEGAATVATLGARRDATTLGLVEGLAELTVFDAVDATRHRVDDLEGRIERRSRGLDTAAAVTEGVARLIGAAALVAVLTLALVAVQHRAVSVLAVPVLVACALTVADVTGPLGAAGARWSEVVAGYRRLVALLSRRPPAPEPLHPAPLPAGPLGVVAEAVSVAAGPEGPVVQAGLAVAVPSGGALVVTGPSGSGKSTLFAAVLGLVRVSRGRLAVTDGENCVAVDDVPSALLPTRVAGSLQGDHVFAATLAENLLVVRPDATRAELDAAAAVTGFDEVVAGCPQGWDTAAGADGARLSGGQRQRLLLARAVLAAPDVLVLDEPAAHLDRELADRVVAAILRATTDRTVLLSSHRPLPPGSTAAVLALRPDGQTAAYSPAARATWEPHARARASSPGSSRSSRSTVNDAGSTTETHPHRPNARAIRGEAPPVTR